MAHYLGNTVLQYFLEGMLIKKYVYTALTTQAKHSERYIFTDHIKTISTAVITSSKFLQISVKSNYTIRLAH